MGTNNITDPLWQSFANDRLLKAQPHDIGMHNPPCPHCEISLHPALHMPIDGFVDSQRSTDCIFKSLGTALDLWSEREKHKVFAGQREEEFVQNGIEKCDQYLETWESRVKRHLTKEKSMAFVHELEIVILRVKRYVVRDMRKYLTDSYKILWQENCLSPFPRPQRRLRSDSPPILVSSKRLRRSCRLQRNGSDTGNTAEGTQVGEGPTSPLQSRNRASVEIVGSSQIGIKVESPVGDFGNHTQQRVTNAPSRGFISQHDRSEPTQTTAPMNQRASTTRGWAEIFERIRSKAELVCHLYQSVESSRSSTWMRADFSLKDEALTNLSETERIFDDAISFMGNIKKGFERE